MSCVVTVPGFAAGASKAFSVTMRSMSAMPVAPEIGTACARHSLKPFHSAGLCEAVIMIEPSAPSEPFA